MTDTNQPNFSFRALPIARLGVGGRWRTEAMRSYGAPVLLWFTRGQGRITINGVTSGYGPHNCIYLPAGTMHGFEMSTQVAGTIIVFPQDSEEQLGLPRDSVHLRLRDADRQIELSNLVDNLQREMEKGTSRASRAMMCHAGLISVWLDRQLDALDEDEVKPKSGKRLVNAYTALVEQDFHSSKTVRDYAAELGITPTHLSRVCNNACGRPASAILQDRITYEARRLLTETRVPIKDIAASLGFTSAAYFTRSFLKQTGQTPSAFRKRG
ncbi:AraC family transcriptional regulator [Aliiroseovarius sp. S1123]|jgi:AraC-like DNA-binding protein|uniref:AraC family transcriptional regulator n=1 Tax=unclassified Aliiroseovarius TaxID=2623558 RepID=UPI001FF5F6CF|nr:AraC family transcriptional regulator [Aliiroseovarius sp. S1123]MCK0170370.1 AraC family transcriptional regulator [Aliiroseovarius sp. S1123]